MPLFRPLCSFFVVLALVLGSIVPGSPMAASKETHATTISAIHEPNSADCEHCQANTAVPAACAKAFCAGTAITLAALESGPEFPRLKFEPAPDQGGSSLSSFLDPPPPRTNLVG